MDDETLKKYAFVHISVNRTNTVKTLEGAIKIPTEISKDIGVRSNHISKILGDLKDIGVVECINEEARKGRIYRLTPEGEEIAEMLKKQ